MFWDSFLIFVTKIWFEASMDHISGHSFHISGTVELLLAGVPPEVVTTTGGWTLLVFLLYWHWLEEIILLSTSNTYNTAHISGLTNVFEQFHLRQKIPL